MAQMRTGPKLEFRVAGFSPDGHAYENLATLIGEASEKMDLPPEDLRNVIVTDGDEYGPAIKQFIPDEGYTNDQVYRGIGKILPHYENGRFVCCDLVMHYCVIASFARPENSLPAGEVDALRYCLYHELGHCADYRRRPPHRLMKPPVELNSVVLPCANANAESVLSEYAACTFSAQFVTPPAFRYLVEQTADTLGKCLDALSKNRQLYRIRLLNLAVLRDEVLTVFWRGLVELAKLHAYRNGNAVLQHESFAHWPGGTPVAPEVLKNFGLKLACNWSNYPNCLAEFEETILEAFFSLTEAGGYRFEVKPEGDYLWLI